MTAPTNEKAAPITVGSGHFSNNTSNPHSPRYRAAGKPTLKWQRFLSSVLESPKTTRDLEKAPVFDHVAHSTASELRRKGLVVLTEMVTVTGYAGEPARIARYSIAPGSVEKAQQLLERP